MATEVKYRIRADDKTRKGVDSAKKNLSRLSKAAIAAGAAAAAAFSVGKIKEAIEKAFDLAKMAAMAKSVKDAFDSMATSIGMSADAILDGMQRASRGTISELEMIAAASRAAAFNMPLQDMAKLMEIAAASARAMGRSVAESFDDLVLGLARGSPKIIDNLGLMMDAGAAQAAYAVSLGKTVDELDDAERSTALYNLTLEAGEDLIRRVGVQTDDLTDAQKWQRMGAEVSNIKQGFANMLNYVLTPLVGKVGEWLTGLRLAQELVDEITRAMKQNTGVLRDILPKPSDLDIIKAKITELSKGLEGTIWGADDPAAAARANVAAYSAIADYLRDMYAEWKKTHTVIEGLAGGGGLIPQMLDDYNDMLATMTETLAKTEAWVKIWEVIQAINNTIPLTLDEQRTAIENQIAALETWVGWWAAGTEEAQTLSRVLAYLIGQLADLGKQPLIIDKGMRSSKSKRGEWKPPITGGPGEPQGLFGPASLISYEIAMSKMLDIEETRRGVIELILSRMRLYADAVDRARAGLDDLTTVVGKLERLQGKVVGRWKAPIQSDVTSAEGIAAGFLPGLGAAGPYSTGDWGFGGGSNAGAYGVETPLSEMGATMGGIPEEFIAGLWEAGTAASGMAGQLIQAGMSGGAFGLLMEALKPVIQGLFSILAPAIDGILMPLMNMLFSLGEIVGKMLLPLFVALGPVIDMVSQIIFSVLTPVLELLAVPISLVTSVLEILTPILTGVALVFEVLMAPVKFIGDMFMWLGDQIGVFFNNMLSFFGVKGYQTQEYGAFSSTAFTGLEERLQEILDNAAGTGATTSSTYYQDLLDDIEATGLPTDFVMPGSEGFGGGGAGAQYTTGRKLTVNIVINTDIIAGEDGVRQLALILRDEIYAAEQLGY